jgi:diguanylate cyclase (GGDEF)-like protein
VLSDPRVKPGDDGIGVPGDDVKLAANALLRPVRYTTSGIFPMEPDVSLTQDATIAPLSLADTAFEQMPYAVVILDAELRVRCANAEARARLEPPSTEDDPTPPFDTVLARSGRIPTDVRLRILSCCGAEIRSRNSQGAHDTVFALAPGHTIALYARPLRADRWMVVLEERRGRGDTDDVANENNRDPLTEIGNRKHFETKLARALAEPDPDRQPGVVVFDIDRFRTINDRLGRRGGDALLRAMVGRVRRATREADPIARLEGDAFAVLQYDGQNIDSLAARLIDVLSRPYLIRGEITTVAVSAGTARAPADGAAAALLLRHADLARREAKEAGGQTWRRYGQSMGDRARTRLELEADLRKSVALGQLTLNYQPIANLRSRAVTGFEALARWTHPSRGAVPPSLFIPVAEDIGLIAQIGDWALRAACQDAVSWPEPLTVSVNVSARQLDDGQHFVSQVAAASRDSGLPARRLTLEITEAALTRHPEQARILLRDLHELGVRIALDDFGDGQASLRQVRTFPFDMIKIDRSFIRSLDSNNESGAMVRAVAALGNGLGMTVVAVGVETAAQARMVEADGCTEIQGFLIGKPIPAAGVDELLARNLALAD